MSKHALQNIPGEADLEPLKTLEAEELENIDAKGLEYEIAVLEEALKQKQPNMAVIKEYLLKVRHLFNSLRLFQFRLLLNRLH